LMYSSFVSASFDIRRRHAEPIVPPRSWCRRTLSGNFGSRTLSAPDESGIPRWWGWWRISDPRREARTGPPSANDGDGIVGFLQRSLRVVVRSFRGRAIGFANIRSFSSASSPSDSRSSSIGNTGKGSWRSHHLRTRCRYERIVTMMDAVVSKTTTA
jgi:hypothetical protein